jgi:hypothetical protein
MMQCLPLAALHTLSPTDSRQNNVVNLFFLRKLLAAAFEQQHGDATCCFLCSGPDTIHSAS